MNNQSSGEGGEGSEITCEHVQSISTMDENVSPSLPSELYGRIGTYLNYKDDHQHITSVTTQ